MRPGWVLPMVIWSEFRIRQYRDDDHREDAPHFNKQSVMITIVLANSD